MNASKSKVEDGELIDLKRFSDINRVLWVVARIRGIFRKKSFAGGRAAEVSAQDLKEAEEFIVRGIQKSLEDEMKKTSQKGVKGGRYRRLQPWKDNDAF